MIWDRLVMASFVGCFLVGAAILVYWVGKAGHQREAWCKDHGMTAVSVSTTISGIMCMNSQRQLVNPQ